jgi:hypothetical protein
MRRSLLSLIALGMVLAVPVSALAANRTKLTPNELARAINAADARAVPYRKAKISPSDIRIVRCIGPDEEPTEFECTWLQHAGHGWVGRKTWLAIDGEGWHVLD